MKSYSDADTRFAPNWRHVGAFLGLTFSLTWLLDLAIYLRGGLDTPAIVPLLQLQMLLPAFSAVLLGLLFFSENPIFYRRSAGPGRWFYYYFLLLTVLYAFGALGAWLAPAQGKFTQLATLVPLFLSFLGLLLLVALRFAAGHAAMARVGLSWGGWRYWLLFGLAFIAFYILQVALNASFGLGPVQVAPIPAPPGFNPQAFLVVGAVQTVLLAPFLGIVIAFGEEFGWRGYLQSELFKLGRVRGVLLVGVIWGAWHWPLILMGYNYPGYPLLGLVLMALYTTGLAVVLGYAVLRTRSVLLAAYLHALNDQVAAFLVALGYKPFDPVFSFGIGIYGLATLAIAALLILRDPIWRGKGSNLDPAQPTPGSPT
jgi:membrane protease YdiL (CAAX protease family)